METSKFNKIVLSHFSEIKDKYDLDLLNEWDGEEIGSTILIEDYLMPFIYDHLEDKRIMDKLGVLLEELILLKDDFCDEVLYCSFFEKIHYEDTEYKFLPYFKENTKNFFNNLKF